MIISYIPHAFLQHNPLLRQVVESVSLPPWITRRPCDCLTSMKFSATAPSTLLTGTFCFLPSYLPSFLPPSLPLSLSFFHSFFPFFLLGLHLLHIEVPRPGVKWELQPPAYTTVTAMQDPSSICDLNHSSRQHQILKPLSEARNGTRILMDTMSDS